jgi:hypothetical protein
VAEVLLVEQAGVPKLLLVHLLPTGLGRFNNSKERWYYIGTKPAGNPDEARVLSEADAPGRPLVPDRPVPVRGQEPPGAQHHQD